MTVLITLTIAGSDSGPFDLYSNVDGYTTAFETGVSKSALVAGYTSNLVPNSTITVRVRSTGVCTNFIDIPIGGITTTTSSTSTTTTTVAPAQYKIRKDFGGNSIGQAFCNGEEFYPSVFAWTWRLTEMDGVTPKINTTGGDIIIEVSREFLACPGQANIQPELLIIPNGQSETYTYDTTDVADCSGTCTSTSDTITCYTSITPSIVVPNVGYFINQCVRINDCNNYTVTQVSAPINGSVFTYIDCYNRTSADELTGAIGESITFCAKTGSVFLNSGGLQLTDNGPCPL